MPLRNTKLMIKIVDDSKGLYLASAGGPSAAKRSHSWLATCLRFSFCFGFSVDIESLLFLGQHSSLKTKILCLLCTACFKAFYLESITFRFLPPAFHNVAFALNFWREMDSNFGLSPTFCVSAPVCALNVWREEGWVLAF